MDTSTGAPKDAALRLIDLIHRSPTPFHAVDTLVSLLLPAGFEELDAASAWRLAPGKGYFVRRNGSALVAFRTGAGDPVSRGFRIYAAHGDSPCFRVKPRPCMVAEGTYARLNVETYGSPVLHTWLDRPLSIAGRLALRGDDPLRPVVRLVDFRRPLAVVPGLAPHLAADDAKGIELHKQNDMIPLIGLAGEALDQEGALRDLLAAELGCPVTDILDYDLFLYEWEKGCLAGMREEFISASRLDDLEAAYAGALGFISAKETDAVGVYACFDNEEIGSLTAQGADSPLLAMTLERISLGLGKGREEHFRALESSFLVSGDAAHAVHPNRGDRSDPTNRPLVNRGPVIKFNASKRYISDAASGAVFDSLCAIAGVPVQRYVNRSDIRGGITLGPISQAHVAVPSVDVGIAVLAMHSIRELCGVEDHWFMTRVVRTFFET